MLKRLPTEERQAEIVGAALRLACETSPALITTDDIARAIGLTQGALFRHFPTKDAIWLAAMRWVHETLLRQLRQAADGAATPLDALGAMFHAHVDFVLAHPGVPRFIFHELQKPADSPAKQEVRALLQGYRALLLEQLARSIEQQQVRDDLDVEAAATGFIGLMQGLVMQSMLAGRTTSMRQQAAAVFLVYRRGLGEVT